MCCAWCGPYADTHELVKNEKTHQVMPSVTVMLIRKLSPQKMKLACNDYAAHGIKNRTLNTAAE